MKRLLATMIFFSLTAAVVLAQSQTEMSRADSLFNNFKEKEALDAYNEILNQDQDNFTALWRSSLLYSRIGNNLESKKQEKDYYNTAKDRAERALQIDSTNTYANFVMAVAMGRMALIVGARERVAASRDIKKYAERALEADSSNAGAWHVLGRWNLEISDLNFAERLAANVLFGGVPEGASVENAVQYINKAIELRPDFILYYHDLARAYRRLDQEEKAIESCQTALKKPAKAPGDEKIKRDCRDLIDDLQ